MATLTLTGRLGRDAEVRTVGTDKVASFSVAYNVGFGDKKQTHWVDCSMWGTRAEKVAPYLTKGSIVEVSGQPSVRTFESKGTTRAVMQCRVDQLSLHGGQKRDDEPVADKGRATAAGEMNDDIPF